MSHYNGNIDDFGMDTLSLGGPLEARLKAVSDAGFTQIMLSTGDLVSHPQGLKAAVAAVRASGLRVAEEDLLLRGVGDLLGTRQSGAPVFSAARLPADLPLLARAREAARALLESDPGLRRPEHAALALRVAALEQEGTDRGG